MVPRPVRLTVAGRLLDGLFCQKIEALGEVFCCPDGTSTDHLAFRCGELQGWVCPIVKEG